MASFKNGRARYVLTLVGTAVSWQAAAVGAVRLARVSSLFANVTGTVALPLVPVSAVALFGDRMTAIKGAVAMLMALWGFLSYVYQHYIDGRRAAAGKGAMCRRVCAERTASDAVSPA